MPVLVTEDELRAAFAIDAEVDDDRLTLALAPAESRIKQWVGDDAYADAIAATPDDALRSAVLKSAAAHLAMGYVILGLNTPIRPTGIISSEAVEGAKTVSYLQPGQVATLQQMYLDKAEEIARPYLLVDGTPGGVAIVESE